MKKMMVAVCAMVAAFAAVADGALPPPKFLGFALGDKVDAAVCKACGFSAPEKVVVDKQGTTYYCCKSAAPTEGYDEVWLVLSPESKIVSIMGVLLVNCKAESERKAKELAAKYKAELAARECAKGTMAFEVNYGEKCVEVVLASLATERLAAQAYGISSRR